MAGHRLRLGAPGGRPSVRCPHSEENTTTAGRTAAGEVVDAFLDWWHALPASQRPPSQPTIYDWLAGVTSEPRWRRGRLNRALPQRAVVACLHELGYPHVDHIQPLYDRALSTIDLPAWLRDLHAVGHRPPRETDPRWLWDVYAAACRDTGLHPPKTVRGKLSRWNRYLRARGLAPLDPASLGAPGPVPVPPLFLDPALARVDPYVRFFAGVWWPHDGDAILRRGFGPLATHIATVDRTDPRRARCWRGYLRPLFYVCVAVLEGPSDGGPALPRLAAATRPDLVRACAAVRRDRGRALKAVFHCTHGAWIHPLAPHQPPWGAWSLWGAGPITRHEVGHRPPPRRRTRDRFTEAEVDRLRAVAADSPLDHGLFTFWTGGRPDRGPNTPRPLLHTGCRSGATCSLRVEDVWDPVAHAPRPVASVEEKGRRRREFAVDPVLADALRGAIAQNRGSPYVFPAPRGVGPRTPSDNETWLHRLCDRANVHGDHVHVHALRRTTVSMLLDAGNRLVDVCHWIGHAHPSMTQHYWERSPAALGRSLRLPWMDPAIPEGDDDADTLAVVARLLDDHRSLRRRLDALQPATPADAT